MRWLLLLLAGSFFIFSCAPKVKKYRESSVAYCPKRIVLEVKYCDSKSALSDRIQHLSKIKVKSLETGRSVTLAVKKSPRVKGLCVPRKLKKVLGGRDSFKAQVMVLRCGENNKKRCPKKIRGLASWYGPKFHGRKTASGVRFNMHDLIAAHRTLPLGTILLVKNLKNGRTVKVKVLDRGPYVRGRELDLSYGAAKRLGMLKDGVIPFEAKVIRCGS